MNDIRSSDYQAHNFWLDRFDLMCDRLQHFDSRRLQHDHIDHKSLNQSKSLRTLHELVLTGYHDHHSYCNLDGLDFHSVAEYCCKHGRRSLYSPVQFEDGPFSNPPCICHKTNRNSPVNRTIQRAAGFLLLTDNLRDDND